jgi:UDP-N-acetylglucosamine--N-acetylmuramyl-(pentapeptide) pyrophosphoryl-undecaprenol N-acetylglucosamine transferase
VLTGGGTGGHIYPALSVAQCLEGEELLYVGTAEGPEAAIVPKAGIPFRTVPSRKLSRRPTPGTLVAAAVSAWGVLRGAALLRSWKPDVVLGTGGYASAGVMFAAGLLGYPTIVHEANVVPGRVNKLLAKLCTRIAITYPASAEHFPPGKTVLTGLPVRPDLMRGDPAKVREQYGLDPDLPTLLVSGGSGGAQSLNRAVVEALPELGRIPVQVVHQTGRSHYEAVMREVGDLPAFYHPLPYVDDMPALLSAGTLILCRAGSSTLAEVTAVGLPAIAAPYPFAVADHQTANARALEQAGAAVLVPDAELTGDRLVREVRGILCDPGRLEAMRAASKAQGRPDAAQQVADLLRSVARSA